MDEETEKLELGESFRKILNRHGYGFQYSVIRFADDLCARGGSQWIFEAAEFPVSVRGKETKIDFILRKRDSQLYLIAECKRANPALSNWCFARAPYVSRNASPEKVLIQTAWKEPGTLLAGVTSERANFVYHIGLEAKSNQPGDKEGQGRGIIEEAATQVCKGINGMVEFLSARLPKLTEGTKYMFIPAIFTTARIWTTQADLASASVESGEFASGAVAVQEVPWLFYQYHLSPSLKHSMQPEESPFSLGKILENEFARSIAIVNAKRIETFLLQDWWFM